MGYGRFFSMIATSTVVMFGLMYLNTYLVSHVFWSETRAYMALLMGAAMAFVMLTFMYSMYSSRALNVAIFVGSVLLAACALWLVRSQVTIQDRSYMRAMIPHHSIAIMTSTRAEISDARVRKLADAIIYAQDKEIAEMRYLIAEIGANGEMQSLPAEEAARLTSAEDALATEVVATVDPEFLGADDIARVFPEGGTCRFTYTEGSPAVLVTGQDAEGPAALVRISGDLVRLNETEVSSGGVIFEAPPLSVRIDQTDAGNQHDLIVSAAPDFEAGFRGQYFCDS